MTAGKLLTRALSFLSHQSYPLSRLRRLSTAASADAQAGDLNPSPDGPASVLHFLRDRRVGDDVIAAFAPRQLDSKVGKDLPAKFDLFLALGFSVPEAAKFMRCNKHISLSTLKRRLEILRTIVSSDADLRRIVNRSMWTLGSSPNVQRIVDNVSKLRGWGLPDAKIKSFLVSHPRFFLLKPHCVDDIADGAEAEFGVPRCSKMFLGVVTIVYGMRESTRQSKFRVFESFGWDRSGIITLLKTFPMCIQLSEVTLVKKLKKLSFLINQVGLDPSYITKRPAVLSYSLEKRVRPRFELVNALRSKNLLPKTQSFYQSWFMSEADFMEEYVVKFMKGEPTICNAYINTVASPK